MSTPRTAAKRTLNSIQVLSEKMKNVLLIQTPSKPLKNIDLNHEEVEQELKNLNSEENEPEFLECTDEKNIDDGQEMEHEVQSQETQSETTAETPALQPSKSLKSPRISNETSYSAFKCIVQVEMWLP